MSLEPFLATYTGGKAYPLGLSTEQVNIRDIAHALSQQCRYAGHTSEFWSVAAHSLEVSRRVEAAVISRRIEAAVISSVATPLEIREIRQTALAALLHDASEAYLVDIPKPIKPLLLLYADFEANIERVIAKKFGFVYPYDDVITDIDHAIVFDEITNFYPPGSAAWARYGLNNASFAELSHIPRLTPLDPREGESQFLQRFVELGGIQ